MTRHLILTLDAPMIAFGGETIDGRGIVRDFPARSMLTGLLGNALGYDRTEAARLDALQARVVFASVRVRNGHRRQDYQTARLFEKDAGWTTRGRPEGRAASPSFGWDRGWEVERGTRAKSLTHQRHRDHDADGLVVAALALTEGAPPDLDDVARSLERPERPLFIGRKPFLPSGPICAAAPIDAPTPIHALFRHLATAGVAGEWPAFWDPTEDDLPGDARDLGNGTGRGGATWIGRLATERRARVSDERRHRTGVHGGSRETAEGTISIRIDG